MQNSTQYGRDDVRFYGQELQDRVARAAARVATLNATEARWRDMQPYLESKGYMLRPRFRPDWVPSWNLSANRYAFPDGFEDYIRLPVRPDVIDAERISDGRQVYIKRVDSDSEELQIASMFSSAPLADDPRNHSIPLLDVFEDEHEADISYMVMPLLRYVDNPPFESIEDVVDFVDQILEGLRFMHEHGVAHRDCAYKNILMDGRSLYTERFHPVLHNHDWTVKRILRPLPRCEASVRYYFIDYGISDYFAPDEERELVVGEDGHDQDVPELSEDDPYDPFMVDIFIIGNLFRTLLHKEYANVEFLSSLIDDMTKQDPEERPDATRVEEKWLRIRAGTAPFSRLRRLQPRGEQWYDSLARGSMMLIRRGVGGLFGWLSDMQG